MSNKITYEKIVKVLIIGGSRFVGPYVVSKLLEKGHEITTFNRGNHKRNFAEEVKKIIGDRDKGFNIKDRFDAVIDTCAYKGLQTKKTLEELDFDYFLHFGTIAAYKKTEVYPLTEDSEIGKWEAWGEYNKGKVECEKVLKESNVKYGSIRPVYILGPDNYVDRENFIYKKLLNEEEIVLPGNGQALVQFAFAYDVADVIVRMVEDKIEGDINVAGDETITLKGLVDMLASVVGKTPKYKFNWSADGAKQVDEEFPFANENMIGSNQKMKSLGINPTKLKDGLLSDFKSYYKKNLDIS